MAVPEKGLEFLEQLKKQNGKEKQGFSQFGKYLEVKARDKGVPISGQFELTPLCNFDCKMCYVHLLPEQMSNRTPFSTETWKRLMHQAWGAGMIYATLTGGECLTYPGFKELYLYLQSLGCEMDILTNGFLLDEKWIHFFQEHKPKSIQVTLYGWNDDVYERVTGQRAFTTVKENIRKALNAGLHLSICITPSCFLGEDVLETVWVAKSMGIDVIINNSLFTPREETGRSQVNHVTDAEMYVKIFRLMNDLDGKKTMEVNEKNLPAAGSQKHESSEQGLRCGGGRSSFVIDWKGTMMPCNRLDIIRSHPLEEGFDAAWAKINKMANEWPRVPECEGCPYDSVCSNCAGNMLVCAEPGKQPIAICERTKYYVQHGIVHIPECD